MHPFGIAVLGSKLQYSRKCFALPYEVPALDIWMYDFRLRLYSNKKIKNSPPKNLVFFFFKAKPCPALKPPDNGAKSCDLWMFGRFCTPMCNSNYDFAIPIPPFTMWACGATGKWRPSNKLPDCSSKYCVLFFIEKRLKQV